MGSSKEAHFEKAWISHSLRADDDGSGSITGARPELHPGLFPAGRHFGDSVSGSLRIFRQRNRIRIHGGAYGRIQLSRGRWDSPWRAQQRALQWSFSSFADGSRFADRADAGRGRYLHRRIQPPGNYHLCGNPVRRWRCRKRRFGSSELLLQPERPGRRCAGRRYDASRPHRRCMRAALLSAAPRVASRHFPPRTSLSGKCGAFFYTKHWHQ